MNKNKNKESYDTLMFQDKILLCTRNDGACKESYNIYIIEKIKWDGRIPKVAPNHVIKEADYFTLCKKLKVQFDSKEDKKQNDLDKNKFVTPEKTGKLREDKIISDDVNSSESLSESLIIDNKYENNITSSNSKDKRDKQNEIEVNSFLLDDSDIISEEKDKSVNIGNKLGYDELLQWLSSVEIKIETEKKSNLKEIQETVEESVIITPKLELGELQELVKVKKQKDKNNCNCLSGILITCGILSIGGGISCCCLDNRKLGFSLMGVGIVLIAVASALCCKNKCKTNKTEVIINNNNCHNSEESKNNQKQKLSK